MSIKSFFGKVFQFFGFLFFLFTDSTKDAFLKFSVCTTKKCFLENGFNFGVNIFFIFHRLCKCWNSEDKLPNICRKFFLESIFWKIFCGILRLEIHSFKHSAKLFCLIKLDKSIVKWKKNECISHIYSLFGNWTLRNFIMMRRTAKRIENVTLVGRKWVHLVEIEIKINRLPTYLGNILKISRGSWYALWELEKKFY